MKIVSGFFKFIAVVLMIVVVVGLPLTLLSRSVAGPLLSADWMGEIFDTEMLTNLAEYSFQQHDMVFPQSPVGQFFQEALGQMTHEEWVAMIKIIAPQEVVSEVTGQAKTGFEELIAGSSAESEIVIDLKPIKQNVVDRGSDVLVLLLGTLPACTEEDLVQLTAYGTGLSQEIPVCQPPEPFFSIMVSQGVTVLPAQMDNMPDEFRLSIAQAGVNNPRLSTLIRWAQSMRRVSGIGWLALLLVYLVAIPMGARSLKGVFKWAGWPSLLAGVHALMLGLFLMLSHDRISSLFTRFTIADLPDVVMETISVFVNGLLADVSRPMLAAAGGMIVWGVMALIVGMLLPNDNKRAVT